jgi:hypothetical protein
MRRRSFLGEVELLVLLGLVRLHDKAYGVPVAKELLRLPVTTLPWAASAPLSRGWSRKVT